MSNVDDRTDRKSQSLRGKRIAILATHGFEQSELEVPKKALEDAGATTEIVSLAKGSIKGWAKKDWGKEIDVDVTVDAADASRYDGLVLPGGVMNPDTLRANAGAVAFVRAFVAAKKPVAAICHGPWTLIDAGGVRGHTLTSWPSLKTDLENAGATWVDREVVVDDGLVTSRKPDDLSAFCARAIEEFSAARHERRPDGRTSTQA